MNNRNNGKNNSYIPPTSTALKQEKPKQMLFLAWLFVPIALIIVILTAVFAMRYNAVSEGFRARNIKTEYEVSPTQWNVYGREIDGTATKTLSGDLFQISVQGDEEEGALIIKVTDVESGNILLDKTFTHPESCTVNAGGKPVKFEITAYSFSGHFLIHEEHS